MVKRVQYSLVVAAPLASVRASIKVTIFYINGALLILNCYALYLVATAAAVEATEPAALPQAGQIIG